MTDDRDRRRLRDPLHRSLEESGEFECRTPVERPRVIVDQRQLADDVSVDVRWAQFDEMRTEVAACREERLKRERFRKWRNGLLASGIGTFGVVMAFVVRALMATGASAEASRAQAELVRDTAARVRSLETSQAALGALVHAFLARKE